MIGSVVFFRKENSLISKIIAKITNGEYTHVALVIGYDESTNIAKIIESNRFVNTRITETEINDNHVIFEVEINEEMRERVVEYAYKQLGKRYDYLQILGLFISLVFKVSRQSFFNSSNKFICSELIDIAYFKAGIDRKNYLNIGNITPEELLYTYNFKKR